MFNVALIFISNVSTIIFCSVVATSCFLFHSDVCLIYYMYQIYDLSYPAFQIFNFSHV